MSYVSGKSVLTVGRRSQLLVTGTSPENCMSLQYGSWFPQSKRYKRTRRKWQCFYGQALKSYSIILQYPIGYTGQPCSVWEGNAQGHEYQEIRIIEGPLGSGCLLPSFEHLFCARHWVKQYLFIIVFFFPPTVTQ